MDPARALVLNLLDEHALAFSAIFDELAVIPAFTNDAKLSDSLASILNDLNTSGLVEVTER